VERMIRNAAKALIIKDGKMLAIKISDSKEEWYIMPGGGQDTEELLPEAVCREETAGKKQSFVCDFVLWESKRRKGYATETLRLAERNAVEAGCQESVLFVAESNDAARALYEKCGYQILRQAGYGKYMIKQLS